MPSVNINDAGTWRVPKQVWVNDAGTWRSARQIWLNDAGTWRQVFSALDVLVHNTAEGGGEGAYDRQSNDCICTFANTGVFSGSKFSSTATSPYNWLVNGLASDAEIFFHQVSGSGTVVGTMDTWLNLGTSRSITLPWPGGAGNSANVQVSIRDASSLVVKVNAVNISMNTHP